MLVIFDCDGVLVDSETISGDVLSRAVRARSGTRVPLAAMGATPDQTVVVEDTAIGAKAAVSAGMRALGYAPGGDAPAVRAAGAEIIGSLDELPARLGLR